MTAPAYMQPYSRFSEAAILIVVTPVMDNGELRFVPTSGKAEQSLARLGDELLQMASPAMSRSQQAKWVADGLDRLLANGFSEESWYGSLPGNNKVVILLKDSAAQEYGEDRALRKVHAIEVVEAARAGMPIPAEVASEYESELRSLQKNAPMSV